MQLQATCGNPVHKGRPRAQCDRSGAKACAFMAIDVAKASARPTPCWFSQFALFKHSAKVFRASGSTALCSQSC
eukprot:6583661-Lingulodinium_polyedra.AAC.1